MTVLSVIQQAAPRIGVAVPSAVFGDTSRTAVELQEAVNEAALGMVDDYDWQKLKKLNTITGDGATEDWSLPADYRRMLKEANIWPSNMPGNPYTHVLSEDDWLGYEVMGFTTDLGRWIIYGGQLHVVPAIPNATTAKHWYISSWIATADGNTSPTKTAFDVDSDTFALDERLLKLSLIWRWKKGRGRSYAEDKADYDAACDVAAGTDKGSRILRVGKRRLPADVTVAWPGTITP